MFQRTFFSSTVKTTLYLICFWCHFQHNRLKCLLILVKQKWQSKVLIKRRHINSFLFRGDFNYLLCKIRVRVMVFKTTFNNISVILWRSVEETGVPRENHRPAVSHWQTLSHNVVSSTPHLSRIQTHNISGKRYWLHM